MQRTYHPSYHIAARQSRIYLFSFIVCVCVCYVKIRLNRTNNISLKFSIFLQFSLSPRWHMTQNTFKLGKVIVAAIFPKQKKNKFLFVGIPSLIFFLLHKIYIYLQNMYIHNIISLMRGTLEFNIEKCTMVLMLKCVA